MVTTNLYRDNNNAVQKATVQRDPAVYPTENQAFLDLVNAGQFDIVLTADGTVIPANAGFDYSYSFEETGTDFGGRAFVSTPAPVLTSVAKAKPRLTGNDYPFARQQALNTMLPRRFPAFSLHPAWSVTYAGPNLGVAEDRDAILTRGYDTVAESTTQRNGFASGKLNLLIPGGYDFANAIRAGLPDSDPRKVWLTEWAVEHKLVDNQAAAEAMGREAFNAFQAQGWTNGAGLVGITPNFEVNQASPRSGNDVVRQWINMNAYFMQGVKAAATDAGKPVPALVMYDWGGIAATNLRQLSRDQQSSGQYDDTIPSISYDPEPGIPFYLSYASLSVTFQGGSKTAPLGANNAYAQYAKANPTYAGNPEYMRNTWPEDESHWQKNTDGSLKTRVVAGVTLLIPRTDAFRTTMYGETVDILGAGQFSVGESDNFLYTTYERVQQAIVELTTRAGQKHLPRSNDRQSGWENLRLCQWQRHDSEFKQNNEITKPDGSGPSINPATGAPYDPTPLNHRPQNAQHIEGDLIAHLLLGRSRYRFWMEPLPPIPAPGDTLPGGNHALAPYEVAKKALQRLATQNWTQDNVFQYIIPDYLIRNLDRYRSWYDPSEEFEKKPIVFGGLCDARADRDGKPWFWLYARFPAQELGTQIDAKYWWVDTNGVPITGSYVARMRNRGTFLDDHEVPTVVRGLPPSQFRFQCQDLTGQTYTRTGDYRQPKITNNPTPPALA